MRTLFEDIWGWSIYSKQKRLDFNGQVMCGQDGTVLVDPPALEEGALDKIRRGPAPFHIVLTNKDHCRESQRAHAQGEYDLPVHCGGHDNLSG